MALSYFTESEAPRDFRVSSTESEGHYTKCLLCYTLKINFYCVDCVKAGCFVHSSMPYSDRFSEKQMKLIRIKANRKHVLDRCEKLLANKVKKDNLMISEKQCRDKLDLIRLAIEQRRINIVEKKKQLEIIIQHNNELKSKLPRYQKRVASLGKHAQDQQMELQNRISVYNDQAESLAALRRSRIRQLTKYIFPIYMTYDTSDSIEDLEFLGDDVEEEPMKRSRLHIVAPWVNTDLDEFANTQAWSSLPKEACAAAPSLSPAARLGAALLLSAQLAALAAHTLDVALPLALSLADAARWRGGGSGGSGGRGHAAVCAAAAALCARSLTPQGGGGGGEGAAAAEPRALVTRGSPVAALHALHQQALQDDPSLGRVEWSCGSGWASAWGAVPWELSSCSEDEADAEPEHLAWPTSQEMEELRQSPRTATSLVTSLASVWRGWTK